MPGWSSRSPTPTPPRQRSRHWVITMGVARMSDSDISGLLAHPHVALAHAGYDTESADRTLRHRTDFIIIPILRAGVLAREFCQVTARASVEAIFDRSFYLRSGDRFICVGAPAIGNGPLNLIADISRLPAFKLHPGQSASVNHRHITIGDAVRLTCGQSEPWAAPMWPICPSPDRLIDTCAALSRRAVSDAPREGFARIVFGESETPMRSPTGRIAQAQIASFESSLANRFVSSQGPETNLRTAVHGLIGLGPGLTPSGDDFLMGALALLDALGERDARAALARAINTISPGSTSPLSACFLKAAAAGHIGENLHHAVSSVMTGNVDAAIAAIKK